MTDTKKTQNKKAKAQEDKASFGEIAKALRADPEAWATYVLGQAPTQRARSQVRYFENQSLVVFTSGPSQGRFKWFCDDSSKSKGDMVDLYCFNRGGTPHDAIMQAKSFLNIEDGVMDPAKMPKLPTDEERKAAQEKEDQDRIRKAQWIWKMGSPKDGRDAGLTYLKNRAITAPIDADTLRFRTLSNQDLAKMNVRASDMPKGPVTALIFAARDARGQITAVQQIFTHEGRKAKFDNCKRTNGIMQGAAVWLGDPSKSREANLAEGPETGMSIYQATGIPTCIALGTSNFLRVPMPSNIEKLVIAADMEKTGVGLGFALRAAQAYKDRGIQEVGIALPPRLNEGDFNDVAQAQGDAAVKAAFDGAYFAPDRARDGTVLVTADTRAAFYAWFKTGIEVMPRVPPRNPETRAFSPLALDGLVEPEHNRVLVVETPGIEIDDTYLRKSRPEVEIMTLHQDSREFRDLARQGGAMEALINSVDIHQPAGLGIDEPVFFSLRRSDADAIQIEGAKSVAIRSTAVDRIDFGFMAGRVAIVAPIGNGTEPDRRLAARLEEAGADTTRLTWQIFRADQAVPSIIHRDIPDGYGAADAAKHGWTGRALSDLVDISRANHRQITGANPVGRDGQPEGEIENRQRRKTAGLER